ncbi:hypothetical protein PIB30_106109 [Stylosanthes scabra]|uniref:Uncharacterized protein n=1 Tax=Stylosanthes scabra TaxID=79078 RepID=A0ABU6SZ10_9FABA|nr:hypothetical protein [Stylosanthes scabra]
MPPDTPGRPSHVLLGRPFLKTARFKLDAFEGTFSFESNGICATFTMGDSIEEKLVEHPILWCDLIKTIVVSTLEAKPEKLIEGKASQDGVLNATTIMSTHSKENASVLSEGLRYVPPPLRQATKRGRNSPWMRDKKGKKDKGKLDEPGKKKSVKASGVKKNVSHMEWNHSTNLSELKGQPLEFHHDHSHNKGVNSYLPSPSSSTVFLSFSLSPTSNHQPPPKRPSLIAVHPTPTTTTSFQKSPPPPNSPLSATTTLPLSKTTEPPQLRNHHHRTTIIIILHRPPHRRPLRPTTASPNLSSSSTFGHPNRRTHHHHRSFFSLSHNTTEPPSSIVTPLPNQPPLRATSPSPPTSETTQHQHRSSLFSPQFGTLTSASSPF